MKKMYESTGRWSDTFEQFNVNTSDILTHLIKEAAKCDRFSSDLFIDWNHVDDDLKNRCLESKQYLIGFRDMGVDHKSFIEARGIDSEVYRAVYQLDIEVSFPDIKMTLYKIR